jgi:hypothetical protein
MAGGSEQAAFIFWGKRRDGGTEREGQEWSREWARLLTSGDGSWTVALAWSWASSTVVVMEEES